jgi:hypothetical protein
MPIRLEQLGELVTKVANERGISATVVAVLPGHSDGCYTEVMLDVLERSANRRVSIGVQRDADVRDLRTRIADELDSLMVHPGAELVSRS